MPQAFRPAILWIAGAVLFFVLATANAGGYRYGASDQAFYIPAIRDAMTPPLFPRDSAMLAAQGGAILWDGIVGGLTTGLGVPLPWVFFGVYVLGVIALYAGGTLTAHVAGVGAWGTVALMAALTLRHRIAKTGVNTLEGYLHPRMIAFAIGLFATAAFLKRRPVAALVAILIAGAVHPTTAVWFALLIGVAACVAWPTWRVPLLTVGVAGAAGAAWAVLAGPLASRAVVMDASWLEAVATKDYLFPHAWPVYAWLLNLLPAALCGLLLARARDLSAELRGLLVGSLALTAFFLVTLPLVTMRYALAVQMQIPRVFWLVELTALLGLAAVASRAPHVTAARVVAIFLIVLSTARAGVVLFSEKDGRLATIGLPADDWTAAQRWLRDHTPRDAHVLADPDHAWRYGSSVRVGAERDVFHEDVKDSALAMYDRDVALRVVERRARTSGFPSLSVDEIRALAHDFDLDYLISDESLALPIVYENATFRIYALEP